MSASLVGSEMCIRDRFLIPRTVLMPAPDGGEGARRPPDASAAGELHALTCLLYTSDAADDM
eukprot:1334732-Alexandrium_andersonii.AAC.1